MRVLPAGSRIGRFQVIRVLGKGSMGIVYLASDPRIGRPIALKTFLPEGGPPEFSRDEMEDQFLHEARLAGRLQHPNIVTVYDVGRARDVPFIVMEYVDGLPLKALLASRAPVSLPESLMIVRQVAEALGHAHEKSVLHRDIKPGNVLVTREGPAKVTDFGVGKLLASVTSAHSRKGTILGSPAYMSPEQIREDKLDPRSDLFSLGVVAYELLTGSRPFRGETLASLAYSILNAEPADPRMERPDLPFASADVFRRLLAKSREQRPADAREFLRELDHLGAGLPRVDAPSPALADAIDRLSREKQEALGAIVPAADPTAAASLIAASTRRRPPAPLLIGAAALGLALAIAWLASRGGDTPARPEPAPSGPAASDPRAAPEPPPALPTPGASEASSSGIGAPRSLVSPDATVVGGPGWSRDRSPAFLPGSVERVYRTRSAARFAVRPEQTRIWVAGRYVGIADDWDGWGGGGVFPFARRGLHRVRLELPGYRTLEVAVFVTSDAARDTVSIEDRLERRATASYARRRGLDARTRGLLELDVEPAETLVSAGGKRLGIASAFGAATPLNLFGPAVHEIELSAPNHRPRLLRVLVSPKAGSERARVKVRLKRGGEAQQERR